ncbi:signal peptidase I [Clostridium botulinum]|uniref:Signal peptidase I n=1 Tax=Clostridium botulinum TaxID=1491 RepID=A0A9Q1UYZ3_CLOBO|nr:signal peptidase I [Clostridium botulinum]AEB76808.1 signal peptidase I [Clostridium botulinum BKT015925]KEI02609.1 signal peptidase [Clostridium botulinum D str. 16868]KEI02686.1 signal peptidase [Clostridium botulinum C/D str. Sp77]KLU74737.1 signal peptidase [Clostridium botulinum V891]KOA76941.1 signal peptidase [Clostridium botulinum]
MNLKKLFREWCIPIGLALFLALFIWKFIGFQVKVPSTSMYPTIKPGDHILITRVHSEKSLHRGDIVVFYSKERNETMIKRLMGLPGDKVSITSDYDVYINNKKIDEPYVVFNGGPMGDFKVPEHCYFFMGDNRADSCDSRAWINPYIDWKDIKGKAKFITYPFNRFGKFKIGKQ